ncbi:MAG: zinc transporter ZntB [Xanthomonadales bacterium]|nr:zinc transporter ZntB [Xanthomonadales bacterium]NIN60061.1 zinc transporter ZntB [Xanthomonadales bacterium]NIN75429.1 zinc transporter ZntB [Xanthomonadales bacterium]NIO14252.1 zinc transporter ZntB [Xanthomonadales bacterium]NIP12454.1 zinc transporter ZntB [Xanthomonadales bacterium]
MAAETAESIRNESLLHAFVLDGRGGGAPLDWAGVRAWTAGDSRVWCDLNYASAETRRWVQSLADLPEAARNAMLEIDTRPGSFEYSEGLLVILRAVNLNEGARPEDMISLRIWIDEHRILTFRRWPLQSIQAMVAHLRDGEGPCNTGQLLSDLIGELSERIAQVDDQLNLRLSDLERTADQLEKLVVESTLGDLRRSSAQLRRYLGPQREALQRLQKYDGPLLTDRDRQDIHLHTDKIIQCLEDIDLIREQVMAYQDELFNRLAMEQNSRVYVLSIVAAIFLPLTFVTGLLGMNVGGIPWSASPLGFAAIVGLSVVIAVALLLAFRRKRWL